MIQGNRRPTRGVSSALAAALLLSVGAGRAPAAISPLAKCVNAEQKAAAKTLDGKVKCHDAVYRHRVPVDAACLEARDTKLVEAFGHAEAKGGCAVTGNSSVTSLVVDTTLTSLIDATPGQTSCDLTDCNSCYSCVATPGQWCSSAIYACFDDPVCAALNDCRDSCGTDVACIASCDSTYPGGVAALDDAVGCVYQSCASTCGGEKPRIAAGDKCARAKRTAATKLLAGELTCWAKAHKDGTAVDTECTAKADAKFDHSFAKAESKGTCGPTGAASTIRPIVEQAVADLQTRVPMAPGSYVSCDDLTCDKCFECAQGPGHACEAGVDACLADSDCADAIACINACVDANCVANCQVSHPGTFQAAATALTCIYGSCQNACAAP